MNKLIIGLLVLGNLSAFAESSIEYKCWYEFYNTTTDAELASGENLKFSANAEGEQTIMESNDYKITITPKVSNPKLAIQRKNSDGEYEVISNKDDLDNVGRDSFIIEKRDEQFFMKAVCKKRNLKNVSVKTKKIKEASVVIEALAQCKSEFDALMKGAAIVRDITITEETEKDRRGDRVEVNQVIELTSYSNGSFGRKSRKLGHLKMSAMTYRSSRVCDSARCANYKCEVTRF